MLVLFGLRYGMIFGHKVFCLVFCNRSNIHRFYITGLCQNCNLSSLHREAKKYADIVMFDFVDSYDNLTIKTLVTLDWAQRHYKSQYFFKVDDDVFVKLGVILKKIKKSINQEKIIMGYCITDGRPVRDKRNKWHLTRDMYSFNYFPPFCFGTDYVISKPAIKSILPYSGITPLTRLEDVSLGLLINKTGNVEVKHVPSWRGEHYRKIHCPLSITQHILTAENITSAWQKCREIHVV